MRNIEDLSEEGKDGKDGFAEQTPRKVSEHKV